MSKTIKNLEEIENKLKQYEDLIEDLLDFSYYCLEELENFGSPYIDDNREAFNNMDKQFKQIKGEENE